MPIPYPEAFRASHPSEVDGLWRKRLISLQSVLLSWLALGRPARAPRTMGLGTPLSAKQWTAISVLRHLNFDGNTPEFIDADLMGRGAAKFESFEDALGALCKAMASVDLQSHGYYTDALSRPPVDYDHAAVTCGKVIGKMQKMNVSPAKDIEADRIEFPNPPAFDPVPLLDQETAAVYERPLEVGPELSSITEAFPVVHIRASSNNKLELLKKLADSKRLKPLHASEVRRRHLSGLFAVPKNQTRDRLILDARPANLADAVLHRWCKSMASAAALADIVLDPEQILLASGEDLRDFFYQFTVGDQRVRRNALADPLTLQEARYVFSDWLEGYDSPVFCGLATLAMGDQNACEFAQCSHLAMMLEAGVLSQDEMISLQGDIPRGLLSVGVIIDDLVLLEKLLREDWQSVLDGVQTTEADKRLDKALSSYAKHGLEVNLKKEFRNQALSRFWGVEIDGVKGLLRGSSLRLWPLVVITLRIAMLGLSSVTLLEAIAGSWVSLFAVRRRLLCTMNVIFDALGFSEQATILRLSPEMRSELWCIALLGPLSVCNLRAQYEPFVTSTDASLDWMAAVRAPAPLTLVSEVARRGLRKGRWTRLLPADKAWLRAHGALGPDSELPGGDSFDARPVWLLLARGLTYTERWRKPVLKKAHINVLEVRAHLLEERQLAQRYTHRRFLYGLDSQVSLGALVKGRAASRTLNKEMMKALPNVLSSDLYSSYMYFPSKTNRADGPTRHSQPEPPDIELPSWWDQLAAGSFEEFDAWIRQSELAVAKNDFECADLQSKYMPELKPAARLPRTK